MVVVALVAILAMVGIAAFRKEVSASKASEVTAVIQALRSAQEAYRAEHQQYLDISGLNAWYPTATFGSTAIPWSANYDTHTNGAKFKALGAAVQHRVQYRYLVNAGAAGATLPTPIVSMPAWPAVGDPWYVIQARADVDSDGVYSNAIATSFNGEIFLNNEGE